MCGFLRFKARSSAEPRVRVSKYKGKLMTDNEIRAAHRMNAAWCRQSKEKMRDQEQNLAKAEA